MGHSTKPKSRVGKINQRHRRFAKELVIDNDIPGAFLRANGSEKSKYTTPYLWLKDARIQALVDKERKKVEDKLDISLEKTVREMAVLAFSNMSDYVEITGRNGYQKIKLRDNLTEQQWSAIHKLKVERGGFTIELYNRKTAIDSLANWMGLERLGHEQLIRILFGLAEESPRFKMTDRLPFATLRNKVLTHDPSGSDAVDRGDEDSKS